MSERSPIDSAFVLHAAGALAEAESAYRRILAAEPQHAEAQHYLGVLLHQRGLTEEGLALILDALERDAGSASRYNDLGNVLVQNGALADAAAAFRRSLDLNGADANVWNNFASVLQRQEELADAESAYREALRCDADFVPALSNLAALLADTGRDEESSLFACRAFIQPPLAGKPPKMLGIAHYRLGRIAQAAECYRAWLHAEPGNAIARHYLAACTGENVPARAPDGFLTTLFDDMAESFDAKLVGKLAYRGPEIVAGLLRGQFAADAALDVLDGGCGTGLCAPVLAPYARHLTGVDLSCRMLQKAGERQRYGELVEAELTAYLRDRHDAFDLIVMADTLIYFGDLAALFAAVRQALRPGGAFAFTVEAATESASQPVDYRLYPSGRYGHSPRYFAQALAAAGLALRRSEDVVLRNEFGTPTPGIGVLAGALAR
ncbi:MAG: methyltransferase domain-containing protein [Rhodocyclaceae bacterium]|nr:methyltransferase domain-containing protein [Rhodocyclaceae bacterium]